MRSGVRLDKWLWAARFFKTRALASAAVNGGKVHCNGNRAKPAKLILPGDKLVVQSGIYRYEIEVVGLTERRVSAKLVENLYYELPESKMARIALQARHKAERSMLPRTERRPDKRQRRQLLKIKAINNEQG